MVVYPRWRGELTNDAPKPRLLHGLSPLARGTLINLVYIGLRGRFIPAGAGNSVISDLFVNLLPVYPRWRGELEVAVLLNLPRVGLSPLARGTPNHKFSQKPGQRFIPAGAGNSSGYSVSMRDCTVYPRWRGELTKHNLLLIIDFLSQSQSTNFIVSHKQHIHYVKEHLIH